jgi:hypothetical protein
MVHIRVANARVRRVTRLRALLVPIGLILAFLVLAASASAETLSGESTAVLNSLKPVPETTIVKAAATYDTNGAMSFVATTAAPPGAPAHKSELTGVFFHLASPSECTSTIATSGGSLPLPAAGIVSVYGSPAALGIADLAGTEEEVGSATKTVTGVTTALSVSAGEIASQPFNCALVSIIGEGNEGHGGALSAVAVPISPPPPPVIPPPPPAAPAPPAPAALSILKLKPISLKLEKWRTVKLKVTNTGGTQTAPGSLRVKTTKGVIVKPDKQQLPVLAPGGSWTVSVRVQLTEKAKQKSTLGLTATASGQTVTGSLILKRKE